MRDATDTATAELPAIPPAPATKDRGGRPRKWNSNAERQRAYRERNGIKTLNVNLPADLVDGFLLFCTKRNKSKTEVLEHLFRTQLLRKR